MKPYNPKGCPSGSPTEIVVSAAINFDGKIVCAPRHCHCISYAREYFGDDFVKAINRLNSPQGFITNKNRFITREEAMQIAIKNNQVLETINGDMLFSEDLY